LGVSPDQVSGARSLASEAALAAEINVLAEELATLRQAHGGLTASLKRLAPTTNEQATAALPQAPTLALVGPRGAGISREEGLKSVRQTFNVAITEFRSGRYREDRLLELISEAETLLATLVQRYNQDADVLALQTNFAEQKRLLIQGLQLNTFTARNPGFRQSLERLLDEVSESTTPIALSAFLTYAVSGAQIVSRGGVPHATYSNPNAENILQALYAGYMRVAVINGQTVLCVDNGSSHFNRPGFRGAEKQFMNTVRGLKPALQALGIGKVAFFSGHALEGMTAFDQSKIIGVVDVVSGQAQASKDIAATVEIESYEAVATRAADLRPESAAEYMDYIHSRSGAVADAVRPFLADPADVAAVEQFLRGLTTDTLQVQTTERISGAQAVHRSLGGQIQIIAERQLEGNLKNSTVLHEVVEAALRARGVAAAHALAFVVEQELAPESLRAKLNQPEHYDEAHLRNLVANTADVINAIDRETAGAPALRQRQKDNALLVARVARSVLRERQRVHALALDQRGFFGEETQAALANLLTLFLNSQQELRVRLLKQIPGSNTLQMTRAVVQRGFDLLDQKELDAFFAFFGHKAEVRAGLYTRQVLANEINRLRRSLQGTVYESTLDQAQAAIQALETGQPLNVKVNGEDRPIVDLQIRKIRANAAISPDALKVGAFFTVEETPAGAVGFINVMAHRQLPQATLHELLETVLGIEHRTVADLEAVSEYSLGEMPFFQNLARELFWPTRLLSTIVGAIGLVALAFAVGMIFFGAAPAAVIPMMTVGVMPLAWSSATYFKPRFIITVDGPDATGKTEIGEVLSRFYGYTYADAAMYYRAFALIVKDEIDSGNWNEDAFRADTPAEQQAFATFTKIVVDRLQQADVNMYFDRGLREQRMRVFLREGAFLGRRREITDQVLPTAANASGEDFQRIEALASRLGQIPAVQRVVDDHLRALAKRENLVAVGQTMGTKLFDRDAKMRFYVVNNDLRNRAERLLKRPLRTEAELAAGLAEIESMDLSARTRQRDPLRPIPEAVVLDTGNFTLADVLKTAQQSITRRSEVVRNALVRLWSLTRERGRMLNRIQGESARRQVLEQVGDTWLGFSDIDGLSGYNLIYGKAVTNYLLQDVLGIIEETANSSPVQQIVNRNRRIFRQQLLRAILTLNFRQAFQLLPKLAETRIATIRHGGDEGLYLIPDYFSPKEVGDLMKQFRSRVQLAMHRQFKPYEVLGLKPAEEQQLRAIAAKINEDYGDPKLARVAYDEVYGVRILLRVGRNDLAKRFEKELQGFAPVAKDQVNGNLIELILKKRLEEAGLQTAQIENLNLTQMAWPRTAEAFKPPIDQKGYGYLQEGYLLTPTLSIGATKASRVDYAYVEKRATGTLTRSDVQAWSEALYQLAGDFLHVAKDAGKNQVVVDQLKEPIQRKEKAAEVPVLGPTHSRQLQRQQLLFEDNLILRTGEKPKHDAIYPKHFSTDGFRELVQQRLAVLAGRSDFQPEIHISRAPPESGPDKVHIAVISPETTYLLELEGQYFGPFVEQAREILKQRLAKEWSEEQQRPLEEVLADPALARTLDETMASYVTVTQDGTSYYRFKLLNDAIGYTAGDQTIGLPHMILDQTGLSLLRQPGRMAKKLPAVLTELEREMNDPLRENQVRVALTAVFSEMPTKQAVKQGIGRLFSDLQVAGMAKQGRITTYHPTLRKPALVKQMEAAVTRLQGLLAAPDAQRRMVEEVELAVALQPRRINLRSFFLSIFSLIAVVFLGAATLDVGSLRRVTQPTLQVDTELMTAGTTAQATRTYEVTLDGRQQQVNIPGEAGNRAILSYQTVNSSLGAHVAFMLGKTPADIEKLQGAKTRALEIVNQQLTRLQGQEEPADIREINVWRSLANALAALDPAKIQLHAPVTLTGRELGAYYENGQTYLPVKHLSDPELLAYGLVHENLHPAVQTGYGQLGSAQEEALVARFGVDAFGSMINVSLGFDNGKLAVSVSSVDPTLSADNPEVERAIRGALQEAWRQILGQKARGERVDQPYANALRLEMEKHGLEIPATVQAKPGEGGFITAEAAGLLAGAAAAVAGVVAIAATGTVTVLTGGLAAVGILVVLGVGAVVAGLPARSLLAKAAKAVSLSNLGRLAKRVADFIRGNPMIILLAAAGLYTLLSQQPAEGGAVLAAMGMVAGSGDKKLQVESKVAALVRNNPDLAPVASLLTEALLNHQEHLKTANKFESLHQTLRGLDNYDPVVIIRLITERPQYFVHFEQIIGGYQRKYGFDDFAGVQLSIDQINRMIRRTGANAGRLLNLLSSNHQLSVMQERGIEAIADLVDELGLEALSRLQQQIKESDQEQYYLAYESLQVARYLERIIDAATAPVLICENVAYGMFVTQPLKQRILEYAARKGKQVEFIKSHARSGMSHTSPTNIAERLFYRSEADSRMAPEDDITAEIMRRLMTEAPHVVVLDGSKNQRYPDGFQQFSNLAVLLNQVLNPNLPSQDVLELSKKSQSAHTEETLRDRNNRPLLAQLRALKPQAAQAVYDVQYWTPDGRLLPVRRNKLFDAYQRNYENFQERPGQRELILINATVNNASVPLWLRQFMAVDAPEMGRKDHRPGYFEDFYDFANAKFYARLRGLFDKLSARQPAGEAATAPALDPIRPDLALNPAQVFNIFHDALAAVLLTQKGAPLLADERDGRWELLPNSKLLALVPAIERQMWVERLVQTYKGMLTDWTGTIEEKDIAQALREGKQVGLVTGRVLTASAMDKTASNLRSYGVTDQDLERLRIYGENGATKWQWRSGQPVTTTAFRRALSVDDVKLLEKLLTNYPDKKVPDGAGYFSISCKSREKAFELARYMTRQFPRIQKQYALYVEGKDLRVYPWEVSKRRAAEDMAADLGIETAELLLAGDSVGSIFDNDLSLVADSGFNVSSVRSPLWGVSVRRALNLPVNAMEATRALLDRVKILRADEFQAQPRAPTPQAASPLDGTPSEIRDYLERTLPWKGAHAAFMNDLMQALYALGSSWRSARMLRLTRALVIAWIADRYSDVAPDVSQVVDGFGLSEAERVFVLRSAEENILTTMSGEYFKDRPVETTMAYFWNRLLQTREQRDAEIGIGSKAEAQPAPETDRQRRAQQKVGQLVARNPELEPVARALYEALKDEPESALYGNQFERLHRALRGLAGYQAADLIPLLAGQPDYFTEIEEMLVIYQRNTGFNNFAEVLKVRDHLATLFQDGQLQVKRLVGREVISAALGQPGQEERPAAAAKAISNAPEQFGSDRQRRAWAKVEELVARNPELELVARALYEAIKDETDSALFAKQFERLHRDLRGLEGYQAAELIPLITGQTQYFERIQEILVSHQRNIGFNNFAEVLKVRDHLATLFRDGQLQVKRLIGREVIPAALGQPGSEAKVEAAVPGTEANLGQVGLAAAAQRETTRAALLRHLRRALDFIRGNPMIIIALIGYGLLVLLQQPAGTNLMVAAGAIGMVGISRDTLIANVYKIPQRTSGERRLSKIFTRIEHAGTAVAEIDSFADLKAIYGTDIAEFIHEKTLQIIQHYLGREGLLFRYEDREGNFAFMEQKADEAKLAVLFQDIQTFLFNSFNRRFRVVTLPNIGLDNQGLPLPERDLGVRMSQLRTLVQQYGHGAVGITKGNRVHITYEISAQSDMQHALQVSGFLNPEQPFENLAAMPFENEFLVGLRQGFLYVPKLNVGIAGDTVYRLALAELPGKAEYRTQLPGHQITSRMLSSALYVAKNQAQAIGGGIVVAQEFAPKTEEALAEVPAAPVLEPESVLFNFNLRNDQIFQRWFLTTANDIVENSQDKLAAFDALRQLYDANQDTMEEEEFDYLGHVFMQARRLIEEMRQMEHYALPEAERKFADITMLWESRYGDQAMRHFFNRNPELQPALSVIEDAIKPHAREQDLARLREDLRSFIEESDLEVMATPGRVKHPFSILMNFLRFWNRAIKAKPDFTDMTFYNERNVRKISDDIVGMLLVIPDLAEMQRAVNELIPYLESRGYRIKPEDGHKIKGVNVDITTDAQGQSRIQPKQEGYYDVKLKLAPTPNMPFGAEIKLLPDFIDESATRPGYTLIKQAVLKEISWTVAMGGPSGTGKLEAARTLAQRLNYRVLDIGLLYRGIYAAARKIVDAKKADDLETALRRSQIVLFDDSVKVVYGRKSQPKTEVIMSREQAMAVEPQLTTEQNRQLNLVVQRIVRAQAKKGRVVVVGQDPFTYLPDAEIKIYFDLATEERQALKTKSWAQLPAPKDALNISSEIQKNADMTVRLVEQMIADAILTRGLSASPTVRMRARTPYQALSLRNTLGVAAVWIGILSLGLGLPFLPALGIGLLYPAAKIVTATRLLAAKYGFPGLLRHWGEPVGAYDPVLEKMVDPQTGKVLGEADWPIAWHEGFSHSVVQQALRLFKVDLATLQAGTLRHTVVAGVAEFLTHTLDALTAPLALARLRAGPRWDAVVLSGIFVTSGLLLVASFFVALPAAVPLAVAVVFAVTGLSVAWFRGVLAPATTASTAVSPGAVAEVDLAADATTLNEVLDQVRSDQRLGVAAQPTASVWQRLRESGVGRALNQLRGLPAGLKLLMLLPKPQTNAWAKAVVIGASLAVWAGVSLALVNSASVNLATTMVLLGLVAWVPGHAFNYRLRTTAATPLAQAIADSAWMEQTVAALNRAEDSAQVSILLQELLGTLNAAKDDPQAREAVLEVLASLPTFNQRTATLQMADGSQSTHRLPAILFERPNLLLRLKRVFPVISIDNQPLELPQPRQRRAVDNAA
jgi:cytidylate kinase